MGGIMTTLRLSLGDFDFSVLQIEPSDDGPQPLNPKQHIMFWIIWIIIIIFSSLIFLNFIIAEVSNSYAKINENIDALVYKERSALINEAEDLLSKAHKNSNKTKFPKFVVIRELEDWAEIFRINRLIN